jgi:hypothetical protein
MKMLKLNQQFQSCLKKINSIVPHYISIENRTEAEIEIDNLLVVSPPHRFLNLPPPLIYVHICFYKASTFQA